MPRYVTRDAPPAAYYDDETPLLGSTITVYAEEREPVRTGLVDQHGTPIFRVPERIPFGFVKG